ncbi:MAG: SPOR domain-containing protein [Bacteroidales bacterium]|nr:SPOR domain-containing protein [Bacteroidales bacterium]
MKFASKLKYPLLIISILILYNPLISQNKIAEDFCISEEEYKLYNTINDYRKALNLPKIPLSKSLSFVAKQHINDLTENKPDTNICNFHSWSDKGTWNACCFEKELKNKICMTGKPKELTNYPGEGYEIVYWENKEANADKAFDQWRETVAARSVMTNFKDWEVYTWQAIGVGIEKGFAIVWFGEETDPEPETKVCGKNIIVKYELPPVPVDTFIVSSATNRFYLIYGSFTTLEDAKKEVPRYRDIGFKKAKVIVKDEKFRISLSDYSTKELADKAKRELPSAYKGAWVMSF